MSSSPPRPPQHQPDDVLGLVAHLVRRPPRTDRRLPLICLTGDGTSVLDTLADEFRCATVPYFCNLW